MVISKKLIHNPLKNGNEGTGDKHKKRAVLLEQPFNFTEVNPLNY